MTTTTLGTEPSAHTIETERWPGVATVPSGLKVRVASPVARACSTRRSHVCRCVSRCPTVSSPVAVAPIRR